MSRIAVIGSGISGMAAAYFASRRHEVTLFEAEDRLGGHTQTIPVATGEGTVGIDTGFIVYNERNYPNLVRLFAELKVPTQPSDMSFSVSSGDGSIEWCSRGLSGLFSRRRALADPGHWGMLAQVLRFNRRAPKILEEPGGAALSLAEYLEREGFGDRFRREYLVPMASAVWSTSPRDLERFPAATLVRFFQNHGMLGVLTASPWRTVSGGSATYIAPLTAPYRARIVSKAPIVRVRRDVEGVEIRSEGRESLRFDEVVFACHGDQVLPILSDPSEAERSVFSSFRTSKNPTWLHTDVGILPARRRAWASWNYHVSDPAEGKIRVTYHMNRLQSLATRADYFVTLHPEGRVDPGKTLRRLVYDHPLYDAAAIAAQKRWAEVSGVARTHYCGAYWGYGFHEDGLRSALAVARRLGVDG